MKTTFIYTPETDNEDKNSDNKNHKISFRMTDEDYNGMMKKMTAAGYKSRTKFITDCILEKESNIRIQTVYRDSELDDKSRDLFKEYKKIGTNYNQIVRRMNKATKDGKISDMYAIRLLAKLNENTKRLVEISKELSTRITNHK